MGIVGMEEAEARGMQVKDDWMKLSGWLDKGKWGRKKVAEDFLTWK